MAVESPEGGSALLLKICQAQRIPVVVTRLVMLEAAHNVRLKLGESAMLRFYDLITELEPEIVPDPTDEELAVAARFASKTHAQVIAGARKGTALFVVTLDRIHLRDWVRIDREIPTFAWAPDYLLRIFVS